MAKRSASVPSVSKSEEANQRAKDAAAAARKARQDAAKTSAAESAEAAASMQDMEGPSKEARLGAPMSDDGTRLKQEATPKAFKAGTFIETEAGGLMGLIKQAVELNVIPSPDWDENRLRAEIQMAREGRADLQVKGAVPPSEYGDVNYDSATKKDKGGVEVTLKRDYFQEEDRRIAKGTTIKVSKAEADRLINGNVAVYAGPYASS